MLLNISDLLEDYTRKKTNLELSQSLSIQFDKVWIYADGVEQEISMKTSKRGYCCFSNGSDDSYRWRSCGYDMVNEASFTG